MHLRPPLFLNKLKHLNILNWQIIAFNSLSKHEVISNQIAKFFLNFFVNNITIWVSWFYISELTRKYR